MNFTTIKGQLAGDWMSQHQMTIIQVLHLFVVEVIGAEIKYFTDSVPPIVFTE